MEVTDIETIPLRTYTESMYVINDRALPHIADGLKPVQRRIVYAMGELGPEQQRQVRQVGAHGGAMYWASSIRTATAPVTKRWCSWRKPFSFRYPLVEGQGNWGAPDDPKSFAAMRYTEARLSKYAALLLAETRQGTVDFAANFDGSLNEPVLLPARVPMLLLNGGTGIAVGMATDIPPHNMNEVISACIHLLDRPTAIARRPYDARQGPGFSLRCADRDASRRDSHGLRDRQGQHQGAGGLRPGRTAPSLSRPCPTWSRRPRCWSRSPSRCRPRSCRCSPICATSPTTAIHPLGAGAALEPG